jgi:hypothetical protein
MAANGEIANWLMQQAGVVVVMGAVIWWLAKAYKEEKKRNRNLSDKVVELCTLWEYNAGKKKQVETRKDNQIIALLNEIKDLIKTNGK